MSREQSANGEIERGTLRSGGRFAARNNPHYASVRELLSHHRRLLNPEPVVSTRIARIGELQTGSLSQTTIRFPFGFPNIRQRLRFEFLDLFREHTENETDGFEVVVTFNAILTNQEGTSFSLFFGNDYRVGSVTGAAPELTYGDRTIVRTLNDVGQIPTEFNAENLIHAHRHAFANSNVRIHQFVNVVYLVYRFFEATPPLSSSKSYRLERSHGRKRGGGSSGGNGAGVLISQPR